MNSNPEVIDKTIEITHQWVPCRVLCLEVDNNYCISENMFKLLLLLCTN